MARGGRQPLWLSRLIDGKRGHASQNHEARDRLGPFLQRHVERDSKSRSKLFYRLVQQSVAVEPVPYKGTIKCYA